ncbi:MAG: DUF1592 domain-containing protein [Planctomycetaceae bacterium]|nr:DUF1592 domain-containing protein [Planctomycetaceae bacterium]
MLQIRSLSISNLAICSVVLACIMLGSNPIFGQEDTGKATPTVEQKTFQAKVQPLLKQLCLRCHNADEMKSGIRLDHLDGSLQSKELFLWRDILKQIDDEAMPPSDELQPTAEQRQALTTWIRESMNAARARDTERNGSTRRLTVSQYRNTLRDLLGLEDNLTDILPPDSVSREGFANNNETLLLSPLLIEAYFDIAEKALDLAIVDEKAKPVIQNFRVNLGKAINPQPCPDKLILGANSHLLANNNFMVTELSPSRPFSYEPFRMRTKYRFIEGYQGNATVRGWRDYDSIYHAVFACMRGTPGYPKGAAYQAIPGGLLLRPAIPSAELFQVESTYGPKSNFKISLRELPHQGRFRVTVDAARYQDGLLLDPGTKPQDPTAAEVITVKELSQPQTITIKKDGIYQADVYMAPPPTDQVAPDASRLKNQLIGSWSLDGNAQSDSQRQELSGRLEGKAHFVDSPFGQAISLNGNSDSVIIDRHESMNVGTGEFTVAAWIHPRKLQQGGIVCLGKYSWTHGWYFDMPNNQGVLRVETVSPQNKPNGTVASRPGVIRVNQWQHVAAVVRRKTNETCLYVNGYLVAKGTVKPGNLDNPAVRMHIGRIQDSKLFHGEIDEVRMYRRALDVSEIQALLVAGKKFVQPPPQEKPQNLVLKLGDRHFSATLHQPAFVVTRMSAGSLNLGIEYAGSQPPHRIVLTPLDDGQELAQRYQVFENRTPMLGVHVGLRRDCGSTFAPVQVPRAVNDGKFRKYLFEGAINNYPSPDVEKDNVNYLAGVREIGVRSEYTDGREMPQLLIRSVEFEGPLYETWPPTTHRNIFIESQNKNEPAVYALEIIRSFATRAFRRPISAAEEASFMAVWDASFQEQGNFQQGIKDALLIVLTSPQFLFLIENSDGPQAENLDPYELASKLSYFLWNTAPDEMLLNEAADNTLHKSLDAQISRMIQDARFQQFTSEFTSQWLSLNKFDVVEIDRKRYPRLTRDTRIHLRQEPIQFLQYLVRKNLPLKNLVDSDFIVANDVVASYYDLSKKTESGFDFVAVNHQDKHLGGILSQASILAGLSDGRESNPIKRGAWLARKIIAEPPDDPPPNVPDLAEIDAKLSLRERLERHRNQKGCVKCHAGIDPWGIPFEQFDAGGRFKSKATVDAASTLPDDTQIKDFKGLKAYLANDRIEQVAFSFLTHLASYGNGRSLSYNELVFFEEKVVELRPGGYRLQDMIRFIIKSDMFLKK